VLVFILTAPILIFPKPDFIPFSQATAQQAVAQIVFMYLLVLFASISSRNSTEWHQAEEQRKIAEKNKLSAELSYLKAQINPHFLFNTLNSIYTLALKKSDNAAEAVIQLAALMRYVLTDAQQAFVPIQQEINYISGYIDLQKMRLSEMTRLDFQITGQSVGNKIAPFLLIPFIENAFKFGLSTETDSTIEIFIKLGEGSLAMVITNPAIQNHVLKVQSTGIGIELTRQRLALIYPQRHSLDITTKANTFIVSLEIQLRCSIA
jgi:LytS/YehU family sensor histidine kinase